MGPGKEMTIWSGQGPAENLGSWTREEAAGVLWGGGRYGILACCFLQVMVFSGPLTAGRFCSWDRGPQPGDPYPPALLAQMVLLSLQDPERPQEGERAKVA